MPIWKLQCSFWQDSVFARDAMIITPHFNDGGVGSDPGGLCTDLAAALDTWTPNPQQITVKAYDAEGTAPVEPAGEATLNVGSSPASVCPREVSLCLSFFAESNVPRKRGRLYIPVPVLSITPGVRPTSGHRDSVGALAAIFSDLGGVDVDWCVWSRADQVARPVTNWWVDDEWDTIRSRGLRATTRTVGTTSEG